jgi:RNA polymerase sigma factor (sigma-70 family)
MVWITLRNFFRDSCGTLCSDKTIDILELCVIDALKEHRDADPMLIVNAARAVGEKVRTKNIRDLYRYAKRAIHREVRREEHSKTRPVVKIKTSEEIDRFTHVFHVDETESDLVVEGYLAQLPKLDLEVFRLHEYKDWDHRSIAAALDISEVNSRFRLHRAKESLKPLLAQHFRIEH